MSSSGERNYGESSEVVAFEGQMTLLGPGCKERGCAEPVVGHSITDDGHVCKRHNELEWGRALSRSDQGWLRELGAALLGGVR